MLAGAQPMEDDEGKPLRHVLLLVKAHDPYYEAIEYDDECANRRGLAELLTDNHPLRQWACELNDEAPLALGDWLTAQNPQNLSALNEEGATEGATVDVDYLPLQEFKTMTLHMLCRLKKREDAGNATNKLYVTLLQAENFEAELNRWLPERASRNSSRVAPNSEAFASATFHQLHLRRMEPHPHHVSSGADETNAHARATHVDTTQPTTADCQFFYRFAPSLAEAQRYDNRAVHIDAIHLPSLMWFAHLAPQSELKAALATLQIQLNLSTIGTPVALWPPLEWEALCEQKDKVYRLFKQHMVPCVWRELPPAATETEVVECLTASLIGDAIQQQQSPLVPGAKANQYVLKGSWADGRNCVHTVYWKTAAAMEEQLRAKLTEMRSQFHQCAFTLQPFMSALPQHEYRIWCVASEAPPPCPLPVGAAANLARQRKRWHIVATLHTQTILRKIAAELSGPFDDDPHALACYQFVEELLRHPLFDQLLDHEMPAVRIDCFVPCAAALGIPPRVLLNEITVPNDAMMFSHCTNLPLMRAIAYRFADALYAQLT
jgi:hypothetical protein